MFDRSRTFVGRLLLLLCLACAGMICEGKTYSKKLLKMDRLGKDGQVLVKRSGTDEMVVQYFCNKSNCTASCDECFENQSQYLVLILHNTSHSDRFDAFLNFKEPILLNFTLDEDVPSTSTTTAVPHETPIPMFKPTESPHTTKMPEALPTAATVVIGILGAAVLVVVIAVIADKVYARRAGRGEIIASTITSLRRRIFAREPVEEVGNPMEKEVFVPSNDRV